MWMEKLCDFMAGWGAGAIGLVVGHPMDTIKTMQQMDNRSVSSLKVVARIMKTQGIIGFYKGMMFPLVSAGTLNSVFFGVYGNSLRVLQMFRGNDPDHIIPQSTAIYEDTFIAGCISGVVQTIVACPSEFIKVRMQTGQGNLCNTDGADMECMRQIAVDPAFRFSPKGRLFARKKDNRKLVNLLEEYFGIEEQTFARSRKPGGSRSTYRVIVDAYRTFGMRGLYTGFVPMLWRDVSASGLYVLAYFYMRHHMHGHLELQPGAFEILMAGGMAGTISWIPVVPLDTIKSRIQADDLRNPLYRGTIDCAIKLVRLGGIHSLFKGFIMIAIRSFPVNASVFFGYDTIMQCLKYSLGN